MKVNIVRAVLILLVVAVAIPSAAQERFGTVQGSVLDKGGQPLPGVTVVLSGANMMGDRTAITDTSGEFRIVPVPPGQYEVYASLSGFQPVRHEDVKVGVGNVSQIDMTMEEGFQETIEVVAERMLIDKTSSKVGANITDELIKNLATDRQYQMVMSILPGAIEQNNPIMHGASGSDNMYLVDGADSSDPMTRTWSTALNFDNIQEVQVTTGGVPAEYGKGTGAVVNLLTKSGSNNFHGIVRFHYTDTDNNADMKGDSYYFDDATRYLSEQRWGANLGGPIVRDNLWFFASYESRDKSKPTAYWASPDDIINAGDTGDTAGNITNSETNYEGHYAQVKMTWSPVADHQFMFQWMEDPIEIPSLYAYIGYSSRAQDADALRFQGGYNLTGTWTGVFTANTFLDVKANIKRNELNNEPVGAGTTYRVTTSAGTVYYGNATSDYATNRYHDIYAATWNQFVDDMAGNHQFKVGLEYANIDLEYYSESYPGGDYIRYFSDGVSPYYRYEYTQRRGWRNTNQKNTALFVQDSWMVTDNLTLNLGLRLESLTESTPQGFNGLDWSWSDRIQPRIGFAWAIGENNLHGSYGRYHDTIGNYVTRTFVQTPDLEYNFAYWDDEIGDWGDRRYYTVGAAFATIENLDSPYMDEFTVGFEGKLTETMAWSVDGIYRTWEAGIEDDDGQWFADYPENPPDDGNYHFTNLGKVREYKGIEFTLRKRLGGDNLQFLASYTYSDTQSLWGDTDYASGYADNPFNYYNWYGSPAFDITHMLKFNGSYFLPWGFILGANFTYWSGAPYSITGDAQTSENSEWGAQTFGSYFLEQRGSRTMSGTYRADLRVEKIFNLPAGMNLGLYVDIFNLTDQQKPRSMNSYYGTVLIDEPGQTTDNNGNPIDTSGFTGDPDEWQAPRSYFFGVKLEF